MVGGRPNTDLLNSADLIVVKKIKIAQEGILS